jgi:hypothetical protein
MGTSDGISTQDWDVVHQFALDIANAPADARDRHRKRLLGFLDVLEAKYGPVPSILATRADYLEEEDPAREDLLLRAHESAERQQDPANLVCVSQSLAELYLERGDLLRADEWLRKMRGYLHADDKTGFAEYERIRAQYRKAAIAPARRTNL